MILQCIYAFTATVAFCIMFNVRGRNVIWASLGGAVGWAVYYICKESGTEVVAYFLAAFSVTLYSEFLAVVRRTPSNTFLIPSIIPLVPGGIIYNAMAEWLNGADETFINTGNHALNVAGALAIGIIFGTVIARMQRAAKRLFRKWRNG